MRYVFKAIDFVISVVFLALCTKALCVHFYQDIERQLHARKLLTSHPPDEIAIAQLPAPLSISVGSSASAFELLTRFDTGQRCSKSFGAGLRYSTLWPETVARPHKRQS